MPTLVIVDEPRDLPLEFKGVEMVAARSYLTDPKYAEMRGAKVFNLCRSYRYQSVGYYVSLLAAARGHKPIPSIITIQDLKSQTIVRVESEDLEEIIHKSLAPLQSKEFILSIYFGKNLAKRYDRLSIYLFKLFEAPFLRAHFLLNEKSGKWHLHNIRPIAVNEIPEDHRSFVMQEAHEYFVKRHPYIRKRATSRYDLAILYNPQEKEPPSNQRALKHFAKAAEYLGISTELIEKDDYGRLAEFDALFIRETTSVTDHTYRFARKALAEGIVVVDDPDSILKCTNKVFLAELLDKHKILTPKTVIVHRNNKSAIPSMLGFPCILKRPDSSFSQGVVRVEKEEDLRTHIDEMFERSDLIIAQEFVSTPFDWRIGIFDRQPLFACKYYMVEKHWQIIKRDSYGTKTDEGFHETVPVEHAPSGLIRTALRSTNLIGEGFYGVDIKQIGKAFYVMEVNDNPNIDAGVEDMVLKDELYLRIMRVFLKRIEQRKERGYYI